MTNETEKPMPELKPCPFCGGDNVGIGKCGNGHHFANCIDCLSATNHLTDGDRLTEVEAIAAWNTRGPSPDKIVIDRADVDSAISCARTLWLSNIEAKAMLGELILDALAAQEGGE